MKEISNIKSLKPQFIFELYRLRKGETIKYFDRNTNHICNLEYEIKSISDKTVLIPEGNEKIRFHIPKEFPFLVNKEYLGKYFDFSGNNIIIDNRLDEVSIIIYQYITTYINLEIINKYIDTTLSNYKEKWGDKINTNDIRKLTVDDLITIYQSTDHSGISFELI